MEKKIGYTTVKDLLRIPPPAYEVGGELIMDEHPYCKDLDKAMELLDWEEDVSSLLEIEDLDPSSRDEGEIVYCKHFKFLRKIR